MPRKGKLERDSESALVFCGHRIKKNNSLEKTFRIYPGTGRHPSAAIVILKFKKKEEKIPSSGLRPLSAVSACRTNRSRNFLISCSSKFTVTQVKSTWLTLGMHKTRVMVLNIRIIRTHPYYTITPILIAALYGIMVLYKCCITLI